MDSNDKGKAPSVRLDGKVAIVTGAARGVGLAVARRMAEEGARIVAVDVLRDVLETSVQTLRSMNLDVTAIAADISTSDGNAEVIKAAKERYGGLDVFHANAAVIRMASLSQTTEEIWDQTQSVNIKGVYLGCKLAVPEMVLRGGGSLIFTASVLGFVGDPDLPAYGAAKGGLRALCRSLAVAYGPQNIRCNTICPGDIRTQMHTDYVGGVASPEFALDKIADLYPLRRIATPEDVANVAVFLASDEAEYITGTDIVVDGGLMAKCY